MPVGDGMTRIRDLREDADLKQKDISRHLHCSQQIYSDYETGKVEIPIGFLIELAKFYHTTTDYILGLTNERERPSSRAYAKD